MKKLLSTALLCASASVSAFAAAGPFDGNWKLDIARSHFEGSTFTMSKTPAGMWRFSDGTTSYDYALDGKPYKTLTADDTLTATPDGDHAINYTNMFKGKVTSKMHEVLSADGKTLTDYSTSFRPDGSTAQSSAVSTRVGAGSGFEGKWKATKVNINVPDAYTISTPSPGMIKWDIPAYKEYVEGKVDGTPLKITGPTVSEGFTLSLTREGDKGMKYLVKLKEKTLAEGHMTLSADGKSFTDVSWTPGKMDEKTTGVYVRQ